VDLVIIISILSEKISAKRNAKEGQKYEKKYSNISQLGSWKKT
jgi:hypothetical protein